MERVSIKKENPRGNEMTNPRKLRDKKIAGYLFSAHESGVSIWDVHGYVLNENQALQAADWLTRYAAWCEAKKKWALAKYR